MSLSFKSVVQSIEVDLCRELGSDAGRALAAKLENAILEGVAGAVESCLPPAVRQLADFVAQKGISALEKFLDAEQAKLATFTPGHTPTTLTDGHGGSMTISQVAPAGGK